MTPPKTPSRVNWGRSGFRFLVLDGFVAQRFKS